MEEIVKEVKTIANLHGFKKINSIKMVDKTRYSALVGKTGVKILVDIQTVHVWQWFPFKKRLILQSRKVS